MFALYYKIYKWFCAKEPILMCRYVSVGCFATCVHMCVFWLLNSAILLRPLVANTVAFFFASLVSFVGHTFWTFRITDHLRLRMFRFFFFSGFLLACNTAIILILSGSGGFSWFISVLYSVFLSKRIDCSLSI